MAPRARAKMTKPHSVSEGTGIGIGGTLPPVETVVVHTNPRWIEKLELCALPTHPVSPRLVVTAKLSEAIGPDADENAIALTEVVAPVPATRSASIR